MNREIKFRGKLCGCGDWVYGYMLIQEEKTYIYNERTMHHERVDPETVDQFTGLKDKNGKEIYEGDILKTDTVPKFVDWNDHFACYGLRLISGNGATMSIDKDFEVIGNIHENLDP